MCRALKTLPPCMEVLRSAPTTVVAMISSASAYLQERALCESSCQMLSWWVQNADGEPELEGGALLALHLINESLRWDPRQPLALHLLIHLTEAASPIR